MTYVDPSGNKVQAASADSQNVSVVDVSSSSAQKNPVTAKSSSVTVVPQPQVNSPVPLDSAEEFRGFIERAVLMRLKVLAENKQLTEETARQIARLTLDLIRPGMTIEELYQKAVKLDDHYQELAPVVFQIMKEYEEKYEKKALDQVKNLVRKGAYEEATEVVKKVLAFKVNSENNKNE